MCIVHARGNVCVFMCVYMCVYTCVCVCETNVLQIPSNYLGINEGITSLERHLSAVVQLFYFVRLLTL